MICSVEELGKTVAVIMQNMLSFVSNFFNIKMECHGIYRQSLVKNLYHFKQITFILIKVPHRHMGNSKRAKVPSSPKEKLGRVYSQDVNTFSVK